MQGMLTIISFGLFFLVGYAVGMMVENDHHKQQQMKRARARHPVGSSIEAQMANDGWKI
jgi:hypothetical protein